MKRTTTALSAFAAGAALLLAGCGSDTAGTAAPAASTPAATSQMSDTSSSEATDDSSAEQTSSEQTSSEESTSDTSSEESTGDETSSTADTSATTTVGGGGGDLDATSVKWFDTYCSGVTPALEEVKKISTVTGGASSDPQATLKKLAPIFTTMGTAFTKTAKDLDGVPVPTFDGGDTLASTVLKAMNEFGPKFTEIGTALAKGDTSALADMGSDVQGLQDLGRFKVDAGTLAAIKKVPSCEPLFNMGG